MQPDIGSQAMSSRKVVLIEHVSLDGFLAGPDGDMSWIRIDDELMAYVGSIIEKADTAIYGRVTYGMMASYWPTAADQPDASAHDVAHGRWTAAATKLVYSRTLESARWGESASATLVRDDVSESIRALKQQPGGDMVLLGSGSLAHSLIRD